MVKCEITTKSSWKSEKKIHVNHVITHIELNGKRDIDTATVTHKKKPFYYFRLDSIFGCYCTTCCSFQNAYKSMKNRIFIVQTNSPDGKKTKTASKLSLFFKMIQIGGVEMQLVFWSSEVAHFFPSPYQSWLSFHAAISNFCAKFEFQLSKQELLLYMEISFNDKYLIVSFPYIC